MAPPPQDAGSLDVSGAVVSPTFRSTPWQAEKDREAAGAGGPARILFISESGYVCLCFSQSWAQHYP